MSGGRVFVLHRAKGMPWELHAFHKDLVVEPCSKGQRIISPAITVGCTAEFLHNAIINHL